MPNNANLLAAAQAVLAANDRGDYTVPANGQYPHQWLWDSCFTAIGWRHLDVERAKREILRLFHGQWQNGMLPNMLLSNGHHDIWQSRLNPNAPDAVATSGITQPPMVAEAVVRIGEKLSAADRRSWYRQIWPHLLAYHRWLYEERDPRGEGLVLQVHPWETGLDDSPSWMSDIVEHHLPWWISLLHRTHLDTVTGWFRTDTKAIPREQRISDTEALVFADRMLRLRRMAYDTGAILASPLAETCVQDLAFNCILIRANQHLHAIAEALHEELPPEVVQRMALSETALERLWDPEAGRYSSRTFRAEQLLAEPTVATLLPLYAGTVSRERAHQLVKLLEDEHTFGTAYPTPSVPPTSPWFKENCYWQGPSWVNINWLIIDGLERYRFKDHAAALRESTLEMVSNSGCYEYFDPFTGAGLGAHDFSWTAALAIDLLS